MVGISSVAVALRLFYADEQSLYQNVQGLLYTADESQMGGR